MRRSPIAVAAAAALVMLASSSPALASSPRHRQSAITELAAIARAESLVATPRPSISGALAPGTGAPRFSVPLRRHVVVGFIGAAGFLGVTSTELRDTSELVTNVVNLSASGSPSIASPGWVDLNAPGFPAFVTSAHAARDKVLVGLAAGSAAGLARMLRSPSTSAARLGAAVLPVLSADHLGGVDLDIEGGAGAERSEFTTFLRALVRQLHSALPAAEVLVNVPPAGASEPTGFFNVPALAAVASHLFVMGYDMTPAGTAGPNAPLSAPAPEVSDVSALLAHSGLVPPSKLILGVPFYGYDFPTNTSVPGAPTTGPAESVTYGDIVSVGHVGRWDANSLTPCYVFKRGAVWHETYYDDPVSIALKTALASVLGLAGVGVWSLGQEGAETAMLSALEGGGVPVKY